MAKRAWWLSCAVAALWGCGGSIARAPLSGSAAPSTDGPAWREPIPSQPTSLIAELPDAGPVLIHDATLFTATGSIGERSGRIERGWIRLQAGRIVGLGEGAAPPPEPGEQVIDAKGHFVTPGLIDTHSHLGVYAAPGVWANADGNEMTRPTTPGVRAEHAVWPQDPGFQRAVAGGVTTIQVLPGSGNLMGGQGVTLKLHPQREARAMRFPGARTSLKMACGENPKRVYGRDKHVMPMSRMGSIYVMRERWAAARGYRERWAHWRRRGEEKGERPPNRDLDLETLARVLDGEMLVDIHCYRADEMLVQLQIAQEFGFTIRGFHHALEAYKIRDVLANQGVAVNTWADWWGFKMEALDAVEVNLPLLTAAGVRAVVHSDSAEGIQRLNQEAAKAYFRGRDLGIEVTEADAIRWITANPAWVLGVQDETGTLEVGKMADVVVWDRHPLSVYSKPLWVFIDGHLRHDASRPSAPWSDFEVGR